MKTTFFICIFLLFISSCNQEEEVKEVKNSKTTTTTTAPPPETPTTTTTTTVVTTTPQKTEPKKTDKIQTSKDVKTVSDVLVNAKYTVDGGSDFFCKDASKVKSKMAAVENFLEHNTLKEYCDLKNKFNLLSKSDLDFACEEKYDANKDKKLKDISLDSDDIKNYKQLIKSAFKHCQTNSITIDESKKIKTLEQLKIISKVFFVVRNAAEFDDSNDFCELNPTVKQKVEGFLENTILSEFCEIRLSNGFKGNSFFNDPCDNRSDDPDLDEHEKFLKDVVHDPDNIKVSTYGKMFNSALLSCKEMAEKRLASGKLKTKNDLEILSMVINNATKVIEDSELNLFCSDALSSTGALKKAKGFLVNNKLKDYCGLRKKLKFDPGPEASKHLSVACDIDELEYNKTIENVTNDPKGGETETYKGVIATALKNCENFEPGSEVVLAETVSSEKKDSGSNVMTSTRQKYFERGLYLNNIFDIVGLCEALFTYDMGGTNHCQWYNEIYDFTNHGNDAYSEHRMGEIESIDFSACKDLITEGSANETFDKLFQMKGENFCKGYKKKDEKGILGFMAGQLCYKVNENEQNKKEYISAINLGTRGELFTGLFDEGFKTLFEDSCSNVAGEVMVSEKLSVYADNNIIMTRLPGYFEDALKTVNENSNPLFCNTINAHEKHLLKGLNHFIKNNQINMFCDNYEKSISGIMADNLFGNQSLMLMNTCREFYTNKEEYKGVLIKDTPTGLDEPKVSTYGKLLENAVKTCGKKPIQVVNDEVKEEKIFGPLHLYISNGRNYHFSKDEGNTFWNSSGFKNEIAGRPCGLRSDIPSGSYLNFVQAGREDMLHMICWNSRTRFLALSTDTMGNEYISTLGSIFTPHQKGAFHEPNSFRTDKKGNFYLFTNKNGVIIFEQDQGNENKLKEVGRVKINNEVGELTAKMNSKGHIFFLYEPNPYTKKGKKNKDHYVHLKVSKNKGKTIEKLKDVTNICHGCDLLVNKSGDLFLMPSDSVNPYYVSTDGGKTFSPIKFSFIDEKGAKKDFDTKGKNTELIANYKSDTLFLIEKDCPKNHSGKDCFSKLVGISKKRDYVFEKAQFPKLKVNPKTWGYTLGDVDYDNNGNIYFLKGEGLYISKDGGKTFSMKKSIKVDEYSQIQAIHKKRPSPNKGLSTLCPVGQYRTFTGSGKLLTPLCSKLPNSVAIHDDSSANGVKAYKCSNVGEIPTNAGYFTSSWKPIKNLRTHCSRTQALWASVDTGVAIVGCISEDKALDPSGEGYTELSYKMRSCSPPDKISKESENIKKENYIKKATKLTSMLKNYITGSGAFCDSAVMQSDVRKIIDNNTAEDVCKFYSEDESDLDIEAISTFAEFCMLKAHGEVSGGDKLSSWTTGQPQTELSTWDTAWTTTRRKCD